MAASQHQNTTSAYDLSMFAQRNPEQRRTLRVVRNPYPKSSLMLGFSPLSLIFIAVMIVAVTSLFIYNNVRLTEIGAQINAVEAESEELESESVRLQASLENKMSTKNIEDTAENSLGMVKTDRSQIEYINLTPEDVVEVADGNAAQGNFIERLVAKIKEYLNK